MEENLIEILGVGIFFGLVFALMLIHCLWCRLTVAKDTITVSDKGMIVSSYGAGESHTTISHYMVYTTNGQAIKNTNCIWFWKFKSDELQGKLKKGKKYRIKTWGVRIPWLGMYKHIITATEVNTTKRKAVKKSK